MSSGIVSSKIFRKNSSSGIRGNTAMAGRARDVLPLVGSPRPAGAMLRDLAWEMYSVVGGLTVGAEVPAMASSPFRRSLR
jgi:hypothetical protein